VQLVSRVAGGVEWVGCAVGAARENGKRAAEEHAVAPLSRARVALHVGAHDARASQEVEMLCARRSGVWGVLCVLVCWRMHLAQQREEREVRHADWGEARARAPPERDRRVPLAEVAREVWCLRTKERTKIHPFTNTRSTRRRRMNRRGEVRRGDGCCLCCWAASIHGNDISCSPAEEGSRRGRRPHPRRVRLVREEGRGGSSQYGREGGGARLHAGGSGVDAELQRDARHGRRVGVLVGRRVAGVEEAEGGEPHADLRGNAGGGDTVLGLM